MVTLHGVISSLITAHAFRNPRPPPVTERPAHTLMNSCPSSVSSLSIVLEGGRSLREVGYVAESASRTFFIDYLKLVPICLSVGNRGVVQTISRALLILSGYFYWGVGWVGGEGESGKRTYHHIVKTSSRLRAAGSPHRGMRK